LSDLYVYAEDRPGELLSIVSTLYNASINIKDIELLKIREGTGGAFRIGFADEEAANRSAEVLSGAGYTAYRL
ncbi:MAG: prephenate dehydrogenase, partial [Rhodothermales bacterium]